MLIFLQLIVVATEEEQINVKLFNQLCLKYNVNIIQTTPSRFSAFLSDNSSLKFLDNITDILVGGEPFPITLLNKFKSLTKANIYLHLLVMVLFIIQKI